MDINISEYMYEIDDVDLINEVRERDLMISIYDDFEKIKIIKELLGLKPHHNINDIYRELKEIDL